MSPASNSSPCVRVTKIGGSVLTGEMAYLRSATFLRARLRQSPEERFLIVVSARAGVTDSLFQLSKSIAPDPDPVAVDLLWSAGELHSVALLSLHLQALGVAAIGLNVHQTGLTLPDGKKNSAALELKVQCLKEKLAVYSVVVVPGFLALRCDQSIVSLGRGGSDLTAVLLAVEHRAACCELIKDVPGYFTCDPNRHQEARHLPVLTHEQALQLEEDGCGLVQKQALETAKRSDLPLVIRGLKEKSKNTWVVPSATPERAEKNDSAQRQCAGPTRAASVFIHQPKGDSR